jgi:hypothetical protein
MPGIFKSKGENLSSNQDELEKVRERDVTGITSLREIGQNFKNQTNKNVCDDDKTSVFNFVVC